MPSDTAPSLEPCAVSPMTLAHSAPPNRTGEVLGDVVMMSPRPRSPHAWASTTLSAELYAPFHRGRGGPGGWILLNEPELHLGHNPDVLVPDLCGWRRTRMPLLPDVAAFTLAPDWVCEILSASTETVDRGLKMPIYARERVRHAWLVDVEHRTLEVFQSDLDAWRPLGTFRGDALVRAEPFESVEFELGSLWAR